MTDAREEKPMYQLLSTKEFYGYFLAGVLAAFMAGGLVDHAIGTVTLVGPVTVAEAVILGIMVVWSIYPMEVHRSGGEGSA